MRIGHRLLLRVGDELGHRVDRDGRVHDQRVAGRRHDRDEPEVRERVEGRFLVEARIHRERRAERREQGVAVGRRLGDELGGDIAGSAGTRVDQKGLLERWRELVRNRAGDEIERRAGDAGDDDLDRSLRVGLRAAAGACAARGSLPPPPTRTGVCDIMALPRFGRTVQNRRCNAAHFSCFMESLIFVFPLPI